MTLNREEVLYATSYVVKVNDFVIEVNTNQLKLENGVIDGLMIHPSTVYKVSVVAKNDVKSMVVTENFSLVTSLKALMSKLVALTLSVDLRTNHTVSLLRKYYLEIDGHIVGGNLDNHYLHKELVKGTQHVYRIKSVNKDGDSDWWEVIILRIKQDVTVLSNVMDIVKKSDESIVSVNSIAHIFHLISL